MPLTSLVVNQLITNFKLYCCSKKFQMLQKNVKSLLEQLKVCIFAEIVFGVRCTLTNPRAPITTGTVVVFIPHIIVFFLILLLLFLLLLWDTT